MPADRNHVLDAYGAAWREPDADKRLELLNACWSDEGRYLDPNGSASGRDALAAHIGRFQQQMPGARIELTSSASAHNARIYFTWRLVTAAGAVAMEGVDFGRLAEDGRIDEIVGFFGPPPAR